MKINYNEYDNINENKNQKLSMNKESWNIIGKKAKIFTDLLFQNCIKLNIINNKKDVNDNDNDSDSDNNKYLYLINLCKPVNQCCFLTKEIQKKEFSYLPLPLLAFFIPFFQVIKLEL